MSAITTHVLDTARGCPAPGVPIGLDRQDQGGRWQRLGAGETDADGRLRTLLPDGEPPEPGLYRLTFDTRTYFAATGQTGFFPEVVIHFYLAATDQHYHVPLLLAPYGYSTYRGS